MQWTQAKVAALLKFKRAGTVTDYETGLRPIPERSLRDFAGLFEENVDVLRWLQHGGERPALHARSPSGARTARESVSGHPLAGNNPELDLLIALGGDLIRRVYEAGVRFGRATSLQRDPLADVGIGVPPKSPLPDDGLVGPHPAPPPWTGGGGRQTPGSAPTEEESGTDDQDEESPDRLAR